MDKTSFSSLLVMVEIFLLLFTGFVLRKTKVLGDNVQTGCMDFLMKISVPAQILSAAASFSFTKETIRSVLLLVVILIAGYLAAILLTTGAGKLLKLPKDERIILSGTVVFKNMAFMGFPVCISILGSWSIFYAVFGMAIFNLFMWTYGISMYAGERSLKLKKLVTNSAMICCVVMILLAATGIRLPDIIQETLSVTGNTCTPLSLIIIGMMLADSDLLTILKKPLLWLVSGLTLVVYPLIMLGMVLLLKPGREAAQVLMVLSVLPSATLNPIVAAQYGANGKLASFAVMHTMLLSLVTIPIFVPLLLRIVNGIGY